MSRSAGSHIIAGMVATQSSVIAWVSAAAVTCVLVLAGCSSSSRAPGTINGKEPIDRGTSVMLVESAEDQTAVANFVAQQAATAAMTPAELQSSYGLSRSDVLPFDATTADSLSLIQAQSAFALDASGLDALKQSGVVVRTGSAFNTFTDGYAAIYSAHLPLFVSADSMMDAIHRSYDHILEGVETAVLVPTLAAMLSGLQAHLAQSTASPEVKADLDVYLAVAAALLDASTPSLVAGGDAGAAKSLVNLATSASGVGDVVLFGSNRTVDFASFTPRGHYTDSAALSQYFRAMIWLGTIDFRLIETQADGSQLFHRAQLDAMIALYELYDASLLDNWTTLHATISTFVGQDDSMTVSQVPALEQALGAQSSAELAALDDQTIAQAIATGRFGTQRIDSYILMADSHTGTLPLNSAFLVLGQRFTVDSLVLSNVVYDRVNRPQYPSRMMPKPLDAAFAAMGNGDALPLLADELASYGYAPELATMRQVIDGEPSDYWNSSLYTLWVAALRALSPSAGVVENPAASGLPSVVGTTAWGLRTLNTQLGSWAELRHDNVLYVKPAASTGVACQFPAAYVEPSVAFWDGLLQYATIGAQRFSALPSSVASTGAVQLGLTHFGRLQQDATMLRAMAVQQTTGADLTSDQLAFINQAVTLTRICGGGVIANGWYPQLVAGGSPVDYKPTIADVFMDPNSGNLLEVGTGDVNPLVVVVETCMGPRAFAGLSLSYYETIASNFKPLTDTDWQGMVKTAPRPDWLAPVLVP